MKKIRIGIIGAGGMAAYCIPRFRRAGAEVVPVADPNPAAAVYGFVTFGNGSCLTISTSWAEMAEREEPLSDPSEAVKLMRIIDEVYASAKNRCPVKV